MGRPPVLRPQLRRDSLGVTAMMRLLPGLFVLTSLPATLAAQTPLPALVSVGLDSIQSGHCNEAFDFWTKEWTRPEDAAKRETLRKTCAMLPQFGPMRGYDIVRLVPVGPNLLRVYLVLRFEQQPLYFLLVAYRPTDSWKITSINWNTNSETVFPASVLPPENPKP